jgi:ribonuclease HI
MLSRSEKLKRGHGHQALKTIYKGAIVPVLTYGAPVWEEAIQKQRNPKNYQRVQSLINIKIAKAYRTLSYEASCVMAGAKPIGIKTGEITQVYRATHIACQECQEYDAPLEIQDWPHPADRLIIEESKEGETCPIEIYTDGSKINGKVGAAAIICKNGHDIKKLKYKLQDHCSNNQAEQIAIFKALEEIEKIQETSNKDKTLIIFTESKITMDLLRNSFKHSSIIESIRHKTKRLRGQNWTVHFRWVKARNGIQGNELVDQLAKEAAEDEEGITVFRKKPKNTIVSEAKEKGLLKWQEEWTNTTKGAVAKSFFPSVQQRLRLVIPETAEFTSIVTGHGNTRAYLYRFRIIEDETCTCKGGHTRSIMLLNIACCAT